MVRQRRASDYREIATQDDDSVDFCLGRRNTFAKMLASRMPIKKYKPTRVRYGCIGIRRDREEHEAERDRLGYFGMMESMLYRMDASGGFGFGSGTSSSGPSATRRLAHTRMRP